MTRKPRRPLDRCDFCGKRVHGDLLGIKKHVDTDGFVSILGIAHRQCALVADKPRGEALQ